jgi:hypothetical protein
MDSPEFYARRRLQVVADADPGAIARVVERFQNLNIIPRRLCTEFSSNDLLYIEVDVCGIPDELLTLIAGKKPGIEHRGCALESTGLSLPLAIALAAQTDGGTGRCRRSVPHQWLLYPRGEVNGTARAVHFFCPHTEQRSRRATSVSFASHPHKLASRCGVVRRSCKHDSHLRYSTY